VGLLVVLVVVLVILLVVFFRKLEGDGGIVGQELLER
jgi:hypothetical protein